MLQRVQVTDTSQHQLKRLRESGLRGRIAAKKPLQKDTNINNRFAWAKKHEQWTLDRWKSILLIWLVQIWDLWFQLLSLTRRVCERMISACLVHGGGVGGLCWWPCQWFYLEFKARYSITSGLGLVGLSFCFSTWQWPNTPPGCVRAIWPRKSDGVLHQMTTIPLTLTKLRWFGMSWTTEWRKSSQQVLNISGNSFKTVGNAFQVKLVECQECTKLSSRQRVATLKNIKYILREMLFWLHDSICVIS